MIVDDIFICCAITGLLPPRCSHFCYCVVAIVLIVAVAVVIDAIVCIIAIVIIVLIVDKLQHSLMLFDVLCCCSRIVAATLLRSHCCSC